MANAIARDIPEVQVAAPSLRTGAQVVVGDTNWSTSILGTTNDYLEAREWALSGGRLFEAAEMPSSAKVAIIGRTVAQQLVGDDDPLDQVIRMKKVPVTVIGILDKKGQNSIGQDQDDIVIVPVSTYRNRVQGGTAGRLKRVSAISVKVREGQSMKAAEEGIKELLRQRFKVQPGAEDPFSIRNLTEILQAQEASSRVMTMLLAAVAGISLVIGGARHHEHHAGERDRAHPRDRPAHGRGRARQGHPGAVPDRGRDAEPDRRRHRRADRRRGHLGGGRVRRLAGQHHTGVDQAGGGFSAFVGIFFGFYRHGAPRGSRDPGFALRVAGLSAAPAAPPARGWLPCARAQR